MKQFLFAIFLSILAVPALATDVRVKPVPMHQHDARIKSQGALEFVAGLSLHSKHPKFGGWSGVVISADGKKLIAISDKATVLRADLLERAPGQIAGLANVRLTPLLSPESFPLKGKSWGDSESLVDLSNGQLTGPFLVGFERTHRIWRYDRIDGPAQPFFTPPANADIPENEGFEAVTQLLDGRILAWTENGRRHDSRANIGWVLDGEAAHEIGLKRGDRPLPTDATTLPNGDVLLVERHYSPMAGVSIQYKRITVAEIDAALATGDPVEGTVIARFGGGYTIDNMEALATRVTEAGDVLIYVMSDDNFSRRQKSLLMVYRLLAE